MLDVSDEETVSKVTKGFDYFAASLALVVMSKDEIAVEMQRLVELVDKFRETHSMTDIMTKEKRSALMSRIKGKDTGPELVVARAFRSAGYRPMRHYNALPGRPDFVFIQARVAVFVDGDFWHGWRFPLWEHKLTPFWRDKIRKNRERDQRNFRKLRNAGWTVFRIWEHQIEHDLEACMERIISRVVDRAEKRTDFD